MKKILIFILAALFGFSGNAQPVARTAQQKSIYKVLTLKPTSYESGNGASVVWHPAMKLYYAARAGNPDFPLDVFNPTGMKVLQPELKTQFDVRGMWYNTKTKKIGINGYDKSGWANCDVDQAGVPKSVTSIAKGMWQPDANSVGCYDAAKGTVCFISGTEILRYNATTAARINETKPLNLYKGINLLYDEELDDDEYELPEYYNPSLIYTGIPDKEFGLLNIDENRIDLFSAKTGYCTTVLNLPAGTRSESLFNFAYTNGTYFIYSKTDGVWYGYR